MPPHGVHGFDFDAWCVGLTVRTDHLLIIHRSGRSQGRTLSNRSLCGAPAVFFLRQTVTTTTPRGLADPSDRAWLQADRLLRTMCSCLGDRPPLATGRACRTCAWAVEIHPPTPGARWANARATITPWDSVALSEDLQLMGLTQFRRTERALRVEGRRGSFLALS